MISVSKIRFVQSLGACTFASFLVKITFYWILLLVITTSTVYITIKQLCCAFIIIKTRGWCNTCGNPHSFFIRQQYEQLKWNFVKTFPPNYISKFSKKKKNFSIAEKSDITFAIHLHLLVLCKRSSTRNWKSLNKY